MIAWSGGATSRKASSRISVMTGDGAWMTAAAWIAVRMSIIIRDMVECQVAIDSRPPSGRARALASATDGSAARRTPYATSGQRRKLYHP